VSELTVPLLQVAVAGPAIAALTWVGLARSVWARRILAGAAALVAHGAAWAVFWLAYRGQDPAWRSLDPGVLGASIAVLAELAILVVVARAEGMEPGSAPSAIAGLGVAGTAVVIAAYAHTLPVQALFLPLPTLAVALSGLSREGGGWPRGVIGLAAADAIALAGLSVLYDRADTALIGPATGLGPGLLLAAAAIKAGAVPGLGTWRVAASGGPAIVLTTALRGQGVALAALAGLAIAGGSTSPPVTVAAASAVALAGAATIWSGGVRPAVAGVSGAAAGVMFLALGLGGAVGTRAFLVLFPPLLLAAAAATLLADPADEEEAPPTPPWRWGAAVALGLVVGSLAGVPLGGGFPGTWLTLSLGATRGEVGTWYLVVTGVAAAGLTVALIGALALARTIRAAPLSTGIGVVVGVLLLYLGVQPVRLGLGWWIRIESELGTSEVLSAAGAPGLPPVGGLRLLLVAAPALALVTWVVARAGGLADLRPGYTPARLAGRLRLTALRDRVNAVLAWGRARGAALALALAIELAVGFAALRLVFLSARAGFL